MNQGSGYKTGLSSMMDGTSTQYQPLFLGNGRSSIKELLFYCKHALVQVEAAVAAKQHQLEQQRQGFFGSIYFWLMGDYESGDDIPLEELNKVPSYLNFAITQLAQIFSLEVTEHEIHSALNTPNTSFSSPDNPLRRRLPLKNTIPISRRDAQERAKRLKYMGNPDLQPIKTHENGFLVHTLHQIVTKINELYAREMNQVYHREDYVGVLSREILEPPCEVKTFCKSGPNYGSLIRDHLPPRLCLRPLASHSFIFWFLILGLIFYLFGYKIPFFIFMSFVLWLTLVVFKASIKYISGRRSPPNIDSPNNEYLTVSNLSHNDSDFLYSRDNSG